MILADIKKNKWVYLSSREFSLLFSSLVTQSYKTTFTKLGIRKMASALLDGIFSYGRGLSVNTFQSVRNLKASNKYFKNKLLRNEVLVKKLHKLAIKKISPTQQSIKLLSDVIRYKKIGKKDLRKFYFQFRSAYIKFFPLQVCPFEIEGISTLAGDDRLIKKYKDIFIDWRKRTQNTEIEMEKLLDMFFNKSFKLLGVDFRFYTDSEIKNYFKFNKKLSQTEVAKRKKLYVILRNSVQAPPYVVYVGERANKTINIVEKSLIVTTKGDELKGQVVCEGKIRGKAYIINKKEDFKNIPKNTIVVAKVIEMDDFKYLKIKKIAGVITEEGGITTHIAISGRELKIPVIMGVKNSTTILNGGDLIELDANKGIVKILKRAK